MRVSTVNPEFQHFNVKEHGEEILMDMGSSWVFMSREEARELRNKLTETLNDD